MFFPYKTDRPLKRTPWVNYSLVFINCAVFMATHRNMAQMGMVPPAAYTPEMQTLASSFLHDSQQFRWYQLISYAFLHGGFWHLAGNMLFLFVFGNNVEDRFGHIGYLAFYLAGGALAGAGHMLVSDHSLIGASGATSAVSGMFVALFPGTRIRVLYIFYLIGTFDVTSKLLIGFYFAKDLLLGMMASDNVSYAAHVSGTLYGILLGLGMIVTGILERSPYDLFALIKHKYRKKQFEKLSRDGYRPWENSKNAIPSDTGKGTNPFKIKEREDDRLDPDDSELLLEISRLKRKVDVALEKGDFSEAANQYQKFILTAPEMALSSKSQREMASRYYQESRYKQAAEAFERYLKHHHQISATGRIPPETVEVQLLLATLWVRYLNEKSKAEAMLADVTPKLSEDEKAYVKSLLEE